jgi:hypothetical protein
MTWLGWLVLAAVITAFAAITGIKPKGTQHLSRTRMMGAARFALLIVVLLLVYLAFRAHR